MIHWFFMLTVFLAPPATDNVIIKVGGFPDAVACEQSRRTLAVPGAHGYSVTVCQSEPAGR